MRAGDAGPHLSATEVRLPSPSLVVLVGPAGSGKSTWAATWFGRGEVVSSDALRAVVGEGEHDQSASRDAFDVLDVIVERRLRRGLTTVVDTLGLDRRRRRAYRSAARAAGVPCVAVVFDTPVEVCLARNQARDRKVGGDVVASQAAAMAATLERLPGEGFAAVVAPGPVRRVPPDLVDAPAAAARQREGPVTLDFELHLPRFAWPGGRSELPARLAAVASAAEGAGFGGIWVMDHLLQIPQVGREWEDLPESWTTLGFLAGATTTARLGTLVTAVSLRHVGHLAKLVATLDVLSGGRAVCGLGAGWYAREFRVAGTELAPLATRYALLEDALEALPLYWGPGSPPYAGRVLSVPATTCYPRPLQERVPLLVGGSGERRTLRLVARHADACNLFGDPATVRAKLEVLAGHCRDAGRDPATVRVTHLSTALVGADRAEVDALVARVAPGARPDAAAARLGAGTVEDQVGRYRLLAEAGVQTAVVSLADLGGTEPVARFAEVIAAFRPATRER